MKGEALLLYDGECRLCLAAVRLVRVWDRSGRVAVMPYQNPLVPWLVPDVAAQELSRAMLLLGPRGRRYHGADALPRLLSLLPGGLPLRLVFEVPGVPSLARGLYRWIATHRHDLGCAMPRQSAV